MYVRARVLLYLCTCLVFVVFASPALAQSEAIVRGRVLAAADDSPISGSTVTLRPGGGQEVRATTDALGRFSFTQLEPGEYVVSAAQPGFMTRTLRVELEPREVSAITIALAVAGPDVSVNVSAEPVTLSGTHSPSSTVLTAARIESLPFLARTGLPEAIVTSTPGMIRGHDDFVHIRGHEIALNPLINGVAFWENTHAVFSPGMSPEIIESANVMTGGFPAEYGNRFGGVVDIVTKSGLRAADRASAIFSGGDEGRWRFAADVGGRRGAFGYYALGSLFETDRMLSPPDPVAVHDHGRSAHAFVRLDRTTENSGAFNVILMGDGLDAEIPRSPIDLEFRPQALPTYRTRQQTVTAGWNRALSRTVFSMSGYERWSELNLRPAEGPLTAQASLDRELLTFGGKADITRLSGAHVFKAGVDAVALRPDESLYYNYAGYRELTHILGLPHIHIAGDVIAFDGQESGGQISAFAQDTIAIGARVTTDIGVRVEHYSLVVDETHVSPRLNVALRLGDAVVHASYNHFVVPPAVEGVLSSSAGLTSAIREIGVALPALRSTVEDQVELGASRPWGPVRLAVTGYYRDTDNPVHTTVWPDSRIYSYASFDRAHAYGLEARADVSAFSRLGLTGYLNYALGRVNFYNPVTGGFVTEAEHLTDTNQFLAPMDQTHTLTAGASWLHAPTGFLSGVNVEYGSGTPIGHGGAHEHAEGDADHEDAADGEGAERVPGHVTSGLFVGMDLFRGAGMRPRLTIRMDVENIANNVYVIARDSEFSPAQYSAPRMISFTARVRF